MKQEKEEQWLPIVDAAAEAGVKERTGFRWAKDKKLAIRVEKGVKLVEVGAVRAYAATRAAAKHPAATGSTAVSGSGGGSVAVEPPGDLAGRVFALFEEGMAPAEVVRRERLPPQTVLDLHRQHVALTELGGSGNPNARTSGRASRANVSYAHVLNGWRKKRSVRLLGLSATPCRVDSACFNVQSFVTTFVGEPAVDFQTFFFLHLQDAIKREYPRSLPSALGRGLRRSPGKESCLVLDAVLFNERLRQWERLLESGKPDDSPSRASTAQADAFLAEVVAGATHRSKPRRSSRKGRSGRCQAENRNGTRCNYNAKPGNGGFCGAHWS